MKTRKSLKSLFATVLALIMVLSLCMTASATNTPSATAGNPALCDNVPPPAEPNDTPDPDEPTAGEPLVEDVPTELPTTSGIGYHAPNQLDMVLADVLFDKDLNRTVATFRLSDAGLLSALMGYCEPDYLLADEVARWSALNDDPESFLHELVIPRQEKPLLEMLSRTTQRKITSDMKVWEIIDLLKNLPEGTYPSEAWHFLSDYELYVLKLGDFRQMVTDLTVNAGGGPDYHYYTAGQLLEVAKETVATEEFQRFAEAAAPLKACEKTTAKALQLQFTEAELAEICENLRATAYGDWSIMLQWLDEMTFSMVLPVDDAETSNTADTDTAVTTTTENAPASDASTNNTPAKGVAK